MKAQRHAKRLGVEFLEKTAVIDVLKEGERAAGAIGFSMLDGSCRLLPLQSGDPGHRRSELPHPLDVERRPGRRDRGRLPGRGADAERRVRLLHAVRAQAEQGAAARSRGRALQRQGRLPLDVEARVRAGRRLHGRRRLVPGDDGRQRPDVHAQRRELAAPAHHQAHREGRSRRRRARVVDTVRRPRRFGAGSSPRRRRPTDAVRCPRCSRGYSASFRRSGWTTGWRRRSPVCTRSGNTATSGCAMAGAVPASPGRVRGKALTSSTWMGIRAAAAVARVREGSPGRASPTSTSPPLSSARSSPRCSGSPASSRSNWCARSRPAVAPVGYSIYKKKERLEEALGLVLQAR